MPVAVRLQAELRKALHTPENIAKLDALGITPGGNSPQEFAAAVLSQLDRVERIVKDLNLQPQ